MVYPWRKKTASKKEQQYFEKIEIVARAIESKHEVIFDHVFSDAMNRVTKSESEIHVSPYFLFTKNGRFYLLGGRLGDQSKGIRKSLYIADIANIQRVKISRDDLEPWSYSFPPEHVARQLFPNPFIREGEFHHGYYGCKIHVMSERVLLEINALFGECYTLLEKLKRKHGDHFENEYVIRLYADFNLAFMLQMRFPDAVRILDLPDDLRESLRGRAEEICRNYSKENYSKVLASGAIRANGFEERHHRPSKKNG